MRKRGLFLFVLFISLNLVFSSVVMSEGTSESNISNIPLAVVTSNSPIASTDTSELAVNTLANNVQTAAETTEKLAINSESVESNSVEVRSADASKATGNTAVSNEIISKPVTNIANTITNKPINKLVNKPVNNPASELKFDIRTGTVQLSYKSENDLRVKVLIEKDGVRYQYNLRNDGISEFFTLQLGNGDYSVSILENTEGSKYRYISTQVVKLNLNNNNEVFLNSNQQINWDFASKAAQKAFELTSDLNNSEEKITALYDFLTSNFVYDYDRYNNVASTYLPDIDSILSQGKGICYDYSALFAAMLRSIGIEAKLIKGYTDNVTGYHAWNEVLNKETGEWIIIDTTFDSSMLRSGNEVEMSKDTSLYSKKYEF